MTAPVRRTTVPSAVGENRRRIQILEAVPPPFDPIQLRPPQMMGSCGSHLGVSSGGQTVRSRGGFYYRAEADLQLETGDYIEVDYFQHADEFDQLSVRVHEVTGLAQTMYRPREAWFSDPWAGGASGSINNLPPLSPGDWDGWFYCFVGVSNVSGDTIHFKSAGASFDADEQYGFDTPNGHVGYFFWNWVLSDTGDVTFSSLSGSSVSYGFTRMDRLTTGTIVGAMLGEVDQPDTRSANVILTGDVPDGDGVIVMVASEDGEIILEGDANARPNIWNSYGGGFNFNEVEQIPHYWDATLGRWMPILMPSEGRGSGGLL